MRALLGCKGHVWPITIERASICADYSDGTSARGEVDVDAGQTTGKTVTRLWLEPQVSIHPETARAIRALDAIVIGPGSFFTSLLPIFQVEGCREAIAEVRGPIIYIANLLTEGRGMTGFTAGEATTRLALAIGRPIDAVVFNDRQPREDVLWRYARESKAPLELGELPHGCELIAGGFWGGSIARHDRARLRSAVWATLARLF